MRVLHVVPSLSVRTGGPAVEVTELSLALGRLGIESSVVATDMAKPAQAWDHRRVTSDDLPASFAALDGQLYRTQRPYRLAFAPDLNRVLRCTMALYDVVHIHSLFLYPQLSAYRHAWKEGVPYVVSPHGALDPYLRRRGRVRKAVVGALWQNTMLARAAALHLTSDEEARLVEDIAPKVPHLVVPNGIDWERFQALPRDRWFREHFLGGSNGPIVMNVGRVSQKKGLDVLIRSFARVVREIPNSWLALVGPDDEGLGRELKRLAADSGVEGRVIFTGMLTGDAMLAALAAADVWALPSHTENFGLAVVEALAAARPVVISPAVNIAPAISSAAAGVVCEQSPEPLAREIVSLLNSPERRRVLGERGRAFARHYDWPVIAVELAAMYANAAKLHSSHSRHRTREGLTGQ